MQMIKCDKCKKDITYFSMQQVKFPYVNVTYANEMMDVPFPKKADLCSECQKELYKFIFGRKNDDE